MVQFVEKLEIQKLRVNRLFRSNSYREYVANEKILSILSIS